MRLEKGEADAGLILLFTCLFLLGIFSRIPRFLEAWRVAVIELEKKPQQETIDIFQNQWKSPSPRIDFGALRGQQKEAEAICIVGYEILSEKDYGSLDCSSKPN